MMSLLMEHRFRMLSDYLDELWAIKGLPPQTDAEKRAFFAEITGNDYTYWVDIRSSDADRIGFLIIGTAPNCHPDADYYIEEAYIKPAYRRKKYMSAAVAEYIRSHSGVYCLFILNKNDIAKKFWLKTFAALGYLPCHLKDVGAGDEYCTQCGFKPIVKT